VISLSDIPSRSAGAGDAADGRWGAHGSAPLWLRPIGLYQYLGVEIAIWMIYALGFNLLFGYAGLHSFGHGAYFGIGAYAFGLFSNVAATCGAASLRRLAAAVAGAIVGALHLAPARHLLRADDHRLRPGLLVRRHQAHGSPAARTGCSASRAAA
jgi:branched-chain amino acid transport system permease protein